MFKKLLFLSLVQFTISQNPYYNQDENAIYYNGVKYSVNSDADYYFNLSMSLLCVILCGFSAGVGIGFLSLDDLNLEILLINGSDEEKSQIKKILPIIKNHHLLLSTMLIFNALVVESLPVFMEKCFPAYLAIIISTTGLVIFGEIIPQALCTGPQQMKIAIMMVPIVSILIKIFYIIAYPLSLYLDWQFGCHNGKKRFSRHDLKSLIQLHNKNDQKNEESKKYNIIDLTEKEINMITQILDLSEQRVDKYMIHIDKLIMLKQTDFINKDTIRKVQLSNYSKIPIYKVVRNDIVNYIKAKSLIKNDMMNVQIKDLNNLSKHITISRDSSILEALLILQRKNQKVAFISSQTKKVNTNDNKYYSVVDLVVQADQDNKSKIGMITIKDIFQVLIDMNIEGIFIFILDSDRNVNEPINVQTVNELENRKVTNLSIISEENL